MISRLLDVDEDVDHGALDLLLPFRYRESVSPRCLLYSQVCGASIHARSLCRDAEELLSYLAGHLVCEQGQRGLTAVDKRVVV